MKNKRILFVLYGYPLGVSTMLINAIAMLKEQGNQVSIIFNDSQQKDLPCEPWLSELIVQLPEKNHVNKTKKLIELIKKIELFNFIFQLIKKPIQRLSLRFFSWEKRNSPIFDFAKVLNEYLTGNKIDIVMPVECFSLIATAEALKQIKYKPEIIYYDMELLDWAPENPLYIEKLELKQRQYEALKKVKHVVITSFNRSKIFSEINNFPLENISILPVVPRKRIIRERSRYFRDKFNIGDDKLLVIYTGNFMPWAQCFEMIESMSSWPKNAVLVMHTWNKESLKLDYFKKMQKSAQNRPVFFSSDYLLYEDLAKALTSADVGLLFYESIDDNFTEICFSSNKMAEYVVAGLPVIASPFPSLKEFIEKHGIGKAVPFKDIGNAVQEISEKTELYRQNVKKCAEEFFVFESYFSEAFKRYDKPEGYAR